MKAPMAHRGEAGVTLIEATIVLTVVAVLAAAVAPVMSRTIDSARLTRAAEDVDAITASIHLFLADFTTFTPFTTNGLNTGSTVSMLVSDGDIPALGAGHASWTSVVNPAGSPPVDFLERHLVTNTVSYNTASCGTGNCWRGAYLNSPLDPDPWGNRYAVNVNFLRASTSSDVFVLSAGPDEEVDTAFTVNGVTPGQDDIIDVVRRDSGLSVP